MLVRLRSTWLAGGGAVLLALSISGLAAAATLVSDSPTGVSPTLLTFEDLNGDGIDDDCGAPAEADAAAAAAAFLAVDLDADGKISTSEAAQSEWIGGKNCNHGGYVSWVAQNTGDSCDTADGSETDESKPDESETDESTITPVATTVVACDESTDEVADETTTAVSPTIETFEDLNGDGIDDDCAASQVTADPAAAAAALALVDTNADGTISITEAAHSKWVGGKNCNHGGYVNWVAHNKAGGPEAAKKDHAAKDALKAQKTAKNANAKKAHGKGHGK